MIRQIRRDDWNEWLRMRQALWPNESVESHRSEMEGFLADGAATAVFVMERPDGGLDGFVEAGLRPFANGCSTRPVGYIEGWYVDADLRRCGVGRGLLASAEAWAMSQGCREMASDCVLTNAISHAAHTASGYEEVNRLIVFRKALTAV